jgi:hypothetical protein
MAEGTLVGLDVALRPGQTIAVGPGRSVPEDLNRRPAPAWILGWETNLQGLMRAASRRLAYAWAEVDVLHPAFKGYDVGQRHAVLLVVPVEP